MAKELGLTPTFHKNSTDRCLVSFGKRTIKLQVLVDNAGNTFELPFNKILSSLKK